MRSSNIFLPLIAALTCLCPAPRAEALSGVHFWAHGAKSTAMGGVAVAHPQESTVALSNPAGLQQLPQQVDGNLAYMYWNGERQGLVALEPFIGGGAIPLEGDLNTHPHHFLGEGGYVHPLNETFTFGLTLAPLYGGWSHNENPIVPVINRRRSKVSSYFVGLTPSIAVEVCEGLSLGMGVDIVMGRMKWQHGDPEGTGGVPEVNKWDTAWGTCVRFGALWEAVSEKLFIGLAGQTPTFMSRFNDYKDFVAALQAGSPGEPPTDRINAPGLISGGLAWHVQPGSVLSMDMGYIFNKCTDPFKTMLWADQVFVKAGASHEINEQLTGMLGLHWYESPWQKLGENQYPWINPAPTFLAMRLAGGFVFRCESGAEWTICYEHGFRKRQSIAFDITDGGFKLAEGRVNLDVWSHRLCIGYQRQL